MGGIAFESNEISPKVSERITNFYLWILEHLYSVEDYLEFLIGNSLQDFEWFFTIIFWVNFQMNGTLLHSNDTWVKFSQIRLKYVQKYILAKQNKSWLPMKVCHLLLTPSFFLFWWRLKCSTLKLLEYHRAIKKSSPPYIIE